MIARSFPDDPPYYKIKDLGDEKVRESFYEKELQLTIKDNDIYQIETILMKRKCGRGYPYLVKWAGYPDKFIWWIAEKDLNFG